MKKSFFLICLKNFVLLSLVFYSLHGKSQNALTPYASFSFPRAVNSVSPMIYNIPPSAGNPDELDLAQFKTFERERPFTYLFPWRIAFGNEFKTEKGNAFFAEFTCTKFIRKDSTGFYRHSLNSSFRNPNLHESNQGYFKYFTWGGHFGYFFRDKVLNVDYKFGLGVSIDRISQSSYYLNYGTSDSGPELNFEANDIRFQDKIWHVQPTAKLAFKLLATENLEYWVFSQYGANLQLRRITGPLGHMFNVGVQIEKSNMN